LDNQVTTAVSFRELVPEIRGTGYLTHSLFYYPARFIPQVPRFCLRNYTKEGDWVIDPFAGSGTVGLEAVLMNRNAILIDINPLLNHIVPVKILFQHAYLDLHILHKMLDDMMQDSSVYYRPAWGNWEYWYEPRVLETLCRYWGWVKRLEGNPYQTILTIALLKASKRFSYAEHKTPKLFKSKAKQKEMHSLLQEDWESALKAFIYKTAFDAYRRLTTLARLRGQSQSNVLYYGGVDSSDPSVFEKSEIRSKAVQALITSPPYLQAQEYIRTSKLELYWLGYTEEEVKSFSRLEIPYRPAVGKISTPTLEHIRESIHRQDLIEILDSYFYYTIRSLENAAGMVNSGGRLCIFVGTPKMEDVEVVIWQIIAEYFQEKGYEIESIYEDKIKSRQLFRNRKNKNPEGMKSEFLLVMKKL
jgi:DNA modification methylase